MISEPLGSPPGHCKTADGKWGLLCSCSGCLPADPLPRGQLQKLWLWV